MQLTLFDEPRESIRGKIIIAGSRSFKGSIWDINDIVNLSGFRVETLIVGGARGVDTVAEKWGISRGIPCLRFPVENSDWARYGGYAGHMRNQQMANVADGLIAIWNGKSPDTEDMISRMSPSRTFIYYLD